MLPRIIDRYLVSEVLWRLDAAIALVTGALMLERMLALIDLLLNQGIPIRPVASMLVDLLPYYFGQALPAAFLMAALLAVARLGDEGAVDAMRFIESKLPRPVTCPTSVRMTELGYSDRLALRRMRPRPALVRSF
jgi:hypothetical protein